MAQALYDEVHTDDELDTDDDHDDLHDDTVIDQKKSRKKGRKYDIPSHTFETQIEAENILKHEFMGAYWKKLNTKGDVSWFQCKCCDKRLKLQLSVTGDSCQVCVEVAFSDKIFRQKGLFDRTTINFKQYRVISPQWYQGKSKTDSKTANYAVS